MTEEIGSGSRRVNIELHLVYSANVKVITNQNTVRNYFFNEKIIDPVVTVNGTEVQMQSQTPPDKIPLVDLKTWNGNYVSGTMHCFVYRFSLSYEPQYEISASEEKKGLFKKEVKTTKNFVPKTEFEISLSFKDDSDIHWSWTIPAAPVHLEGQQTSDVRYFLSAVRTDATRNFNDFLNGF